MDARMIEVMTTYGINASLLVLAAVAFFGEILRNQGLTLSRKLLWGLSFVIPAFPSFVVYRLACAERRQELGFSFRVFLVSELVLAVFVSLALLTTIPYWV